MSLINEGNYLVMEVTFGCLLHYTSPQSFIMIMTQLNVQPFQPLILIYRRSNFFVSSLYVHHFICIYLILFDLWKLSVNMTICKVRRNALAYEKIQLKCDITYKKFSCRCFSTYCLSCINRTVILGLFNLNLMTQRLRHNNHQNLFY